MDLKTIQTELVKLSDIIPNPNNPRIIKDDKFKKLVKSIQDFPEMLTLRPIVVNDDMVILGGNMRLKACKEAGLKKVPIAKASQLTPEQQQEFIIKDNIGYGEWQWDMLANDYDVEKLEEWGLDVPDFNTKELTAEEDDFDTTPPEEPKTVLGDIYEIGEHRLLCGDSTDINNVSKVTKNEKPKIVLSDPPYGMFLDTDYSGMSWGDRKGKKYEQVIGDHEDFDEGLINIFYAAFADCEEWFLWGADYYFELLPDFKEGNFIVWDKTLQSNGDGGASSEYELCWSRKKHKRKVINFNWFRYFGLSSQDNKKRLHPTQKPIEVNSYFIKEYTNDNELIIDLYLGSGTTMVAAHQLNRKCYGMELDPKYCDVIVKRMITLDPSLNIKRNGIDVTNEWKDGK